MAQPVGDPVTRPRRGARERAHAWLVTGPPGHLWSAVADLVEFFARAVLARLASALSRLRRP